MRYLVIEHFLLGFVEVIVENVVGTDRWILLDHFQLKRKVQKIKDNRDYSFLLSEDAELPASREQPPARSLPALCSGMLIFRRVLICCFFCHAILKLTQLLYDVEDARSAKFSSQSKSSASNVKHSNGGHEERRPVFTNGYTNPRPGSANGRTKPRPGSSNSHSNPRPGSANGHTNPRPGSSSSHMNHRPGPKLSSDSKPQIVANRKQLGSNSGNGPGRPAVSNGLPPKKPIVPPPKSSSQSLKSSTPSGVKPPTAKMQSVTKYQAEPRRDMQEANRGIVPSKHTLSSSRPQFQAQVIALLCCSILLWHVGYF